MSVRRTEGAVRGKPRMSQERPIQRIPAEAMARAARGMTNTLPTSSLSDRAETAHKFDTVMILCGPAARASELSRLGRPPGLLPIDFAARNNVQRTLQAVTPFVAGDDPVSRIRILVEQKADVSSWPDVCPIGRYVRDQAAFRGTAGVLKDACADLSPDDRVLVVSGGEVLEGNLHPIVAKVGQIEGDVVLCRDAKHRPVSIWSIRAGCLEDVSSVGYSDFKEQVLSQLARRCDVRVLTLPSSEGRFHWLRDLGDYLGCVREITGGSPQFRVCEEDVEIADGALVVDSVLLKGARIQAGAIVARSVIGAGVVIPSGRRVIDQVVTIDG